MSTWVSEEGSLPGFIRSLPGRWRLADTRRRPLRCCRYHSCFFSQVQGDFLPTCTLMAVINKKKHACTVSCTSHVFCLLICYTGLLVARSQSETHNQRVLVDRNLSLLLVYLGTHHAFMWSSPAIKNEKQFLSISRQSWSWKSFFALAFIAVKQEVEAISVHHYGYFSVSGGRSLDY